MYVFSNCAYYSHNISNLSCENNFEHHIEYSIPKVLVIYLYLKKNSKKLFNLPQIKWKP
jgi:hypothetical protein